MNLVGRGLTWLGGSIVDVVTGVGQGTRMVGQAVRSIFRRPFQVRAYLYPVIEIGIGSLGLALVMAALVGMVLVFQFGYGLERFGAKVYVGQTTATALFRELGPVLTALVVGGRIGAGIAAELGGMAVTEQIDAMRALGANPMQRLVAPRLVATTVSLPLLAICVDVVGMAGGMLVAKFQYELSPQLYLSGIYEHVTIWDFCSGIIKTVVFGFLIGAVACLRGSKARGGTEGVGKATTEAVVIGALAVLGINVILTKAFL